MGIHEKLKALLASEATTMTEISRRLLCEKGRHLTMNNLSRKLRMKTIKFEEVNEIANLLGYDIDFKKRI
ncbi:MAG: hypothetical protein LBK53_03360 [Heliobacteriaceae bacterium]|jgi:hypothetical protein|nr:hypothetical protein [Heliobacteriaceae bacterium]